ncbi:MAG: serine/threonine protein kinase [Bacteroidales bacterium]|nr:serine/threonine protein kinase [Bacteroidales bacterium]
MNQEEFFKRYNFNVRTDHLGSGGFGTVYKAYDNILHRDVALKRSEVKYLPDGKVFSLKDEFESLAHVPKHPNIANYEELYTFEMSNGIFDFAIMQFYPDGNLTSAIRQGLTLEQKESLARQLLDGIAFLHNHKVIHRDLKPDNILVVRRGMEICPVITDFGLSKPADMENRSIFSNSFLGGSPRYSSPEQFLQKQLRMNTDLWSYGVVVYELFTGEPLFGLDYDVKDPVRVEHEICKKITNGDLGGRLSNVPERWRRVLERCLVVDPEKRVKSAEELYGYLLPNDEETKVYAASSVPLKKNSPSVSETTRVEGKATDSVSAKPKKTAPFVSEKIKMKSKNGGKKITIGSYREAAMDNGRVAKRSWIKNAWEWLKDDGFFRKVLAYFIILMPAAIGILIDVFTDLDKYPVGEGIVCAVFIILSVLVWMMYKEFSLARMLLFFLIPLPAIIGLLICIFLIPDHHDTMEKVISVISVVISGGVLLIYGKKNW